MLMIHLLMWSYVHVFVIPANNITGGGDLGKYQTDYFDPEKTTPLPHHGNGPIHLPRFCPCVWITLSLSCGGLSM